MLNTQDIGDQWSLAYWCFIFGAAVLSALSGIFLKLDAFKDDRILSLTQTDISAILAGIATRFIAIASAGDFSGKWKANRTAKNRTEQLVNDFFNPMEIKKNASLSENAMFEVYFQRFLQTMHMC